jgi:hypothetical protein
MGLSTYTELKASIANWLVRADLTAVIPDFITLCEADLRKGLLTKGTRVISTVPLLLANLGTDPLPTGVKTLEDLALDVSGSDGRIEITTPARLFYYRTLFGTSGIPRYAAVVGDNIMTAPIPDRDYSANAVYSAELTPLSASVASNWLLTNHSDVYLYGSLIHSAPFLKDDARLDVWGKMYSTALDRLELAKARAEFGVNAPVGMPRRAF